MPRGRGSHYSPDPDGSRYQLHKRQRVELRDISQMRDLNDSYRPLYSTTVPGRNAGPPSKKRKFVGEYQETERVSTSPAQPDTDLSLGSTYTTTSSSKTKHNRKSNPSTRIHSLRKLLTHGAEKLPGTVRQEKERELAALLFDQEKARAKEQTKHNLKKYHMVRFFERKKAERALKRLLQQRQTEDLEMQTDNDNADTENDTTQTTGTKAEERKKLNKAIHEAEVDVAYTIYSPLGEKYISLFVFDPNTRHAAFKPKTKKPIYEMFSEEQKQELRQVDNETSNVIHTALGTKPPMWYEVEECMREGQASLDALREGRRGDKAGRVDHELAARGGKETGSTISKQNAIGEKRKVPSFLEEDGHIDPADLDTDSDENMSDGDGGFFEK